jgi:hypothetical protein
MVVENNDNTGWFGCSLTWRIKGYGETGGRTSMASVETERRRCLMIFRKVLYCSLYNGRNSGSSKNS